MHELATLLARFFGRAGTLHAMQRTVVSRCERHIRDLSREWVVAACFPSSMVAHSAAGARNWKARPLERDLNLAWMRWLHKANGPLIRVHSSCVASLHGIIPYLG